MWKGEEGRREASEKEAGGEGKFVLSFLFERKGDREERRKDRACNNKFIH